MLLFPLISATSINGLKNVNTSQQIEFVTCNTVVRQIIRGVEGGKPVPNIEKELKTFCSKIPRPQLNICINLATSQVGKIVNLAKEHKLPDYICEVLGFPAPHAPKFSVTPEKCVEYVNLLRRGRLLEDPVPVTAATEKTSIPSLAEKKPLIGVIKPEEQTSEKTSIPSLAEKKPLIGGMKHDEHVEKPFHPVKELNTTTQILVHRAPFGLSPFKKLANRRNIGVGTCGNISDLSELQLCRAITRIALKEFGPDLGGRDAESVCELLGNEKKLIELKEKKEPTMKIAPAKRRNLTRLEDTSRPVRPGVIPVKIHPIRKVQNVTQPTVNRPT